MRSGGTRRLLLLSLLLAAIVGVVWWIAAGDRAPRVEPASNSGSRDESEREQSSDAPTPAPPDSPLAGDRSLDVERSRDASPRRVLQGFVVDRAGKRVLGALISWGETAREYSDPKRRFTAYGGEYALPGLPAAVVRFRVSATGCSTLDLALDLSQGGTLRHDFVLDRSSLITVRLRTPSGVALNNGLFSPLVHDFDSKLAVVATDAPLTKIEPVAFNYYEGMSLGTLHRAGPGRRRRPNEVEVPPGAFGVLEVPRLPIEATLLFEHVVIDHQRLEAGATEVVFTLDPAQIGRWTSVVRLRVVDGRSGQPIPGAMAGVFDAQISGPGIPVAPDGTFEQRWIAPGWMRVEIQSPEHALWRRTLLCKPGAIVDLGTVELPRGITLTGTIVDEAGKPALASFEALPSADYVPGHPFSSFTERGMEAPGEWRLERLAPGRHQVRAWWRGRQAWAVVDVSESTPPVALTLRPSVKVEIVGGFDAAREGAAVGAACSVDLMRADGFVVTTLVWAAAVATFDRTAFFELLPGSYVCTVRVGATLRRSVAFEVGEEPLRVRFALDSDEPPELLPLLSKAVVGAPGAPVADPTIVVQPPTAATAEPPGLSIAGRVLDPTGAPVDGARLTARDPDGSYSAAVLGADGSFVVTVLRPGRHELVATAEGCRPAHATVELAADQEADEPTLVLRRMTRLAVTFTDPAGQPLEPLYERHFRGSQLENDFTVVVTRTPPPDSWPRASFSLASWKPKSNGSGGTLDLREAPPLHAAVVFGGSVVATLPIAADATALRFAIDPELFDAQLATLRVRLVDGLTGEPITRAFVFVQTAAVDGLSQAEEAAKRVQPDGVHRLERLPPGRRQLSLAKAGGIATVMMVDLPAGGTLDVGDVELLDAVELHGLLVTDAGLPVSAGIRVIEYDADGEPQLDGVHHSIDSDADGRFSFWTSRPRIRLQQENLPAYATAPLVVDVAAAAAAKSELRLVLQRGPTIVFCPPPGNEALRRVTLLRASDGEWLRSFVLDGPETARANLLPGNYRLVVERDGADAKEIAFSVGDASATIELP